MSRWIAEATTLAPVMPANEASRTFAFFHRFPALRTLEPGRCVESNFVHLVPLDLTHKEETTDDGTGGNPG